MSWGEIPFSCLFSKKDCTIVAIVLKCEKHSLFGMIAKAIHILIRILVYICLLGYVLGRGMLEESFHLTILILMIGSVSMNQLTSMSSGKFFTNCYWKYFSSWTWYIYEWTFGICHKFLFCPLPIVYEIHLKPFCNYF